MLRRLKCALILVGILLVPGAGECEVMRIDPSQSIVRTTGWGGWSWDSGPPDDVIDLEISGTFELVIEPGYMNELTGLLTPDRIQLSEIDVITSAANNRTWEFPDFKGFYFPPVVEGSEDLCLYFSYYDSGSCLSMGVFGKYNGTYEGGELRLIGYKDAFPFDESEVNGFYYVLVATPVPEPEPRIQQVISLALLGSFSLAQKARSLRESL